MLYSVIIVFNTWWPILCILCIFCNEKLKNIQAMWQDSENKFFVIIVLYWRTVMKNVWLKPCYIENREIQIKSLSKNNCYYVFPKNRVNKTSVMKLSFSICVKCILENIRLCIILVFDTTFMSHKIKKLNYEYLITFNDNN